MNVYVAVLNYAIPAFLGLILIELSFSRMMKKEVIRSFDTIASLSSGMSNILKDVLGLAVVIVSYDWMVEHFALMHIKTTWLVYLIAFVGLDFAGYWGHRFEHKINVFWNRHIVHHSSEEFNLACALRQNISVIFKLFFFLMIPTAMLGVPAEVVAVVAPLHLFAQFWYHTRLIDRMGFLEHIIVTPSHHRVHHAINEQYLDTNFAQIFIIWDKLFGTFQEELKDVPPVYGVKRQVNTWNPYLINFQHLWLIIKDAWFTQNWADKLKVWFMPTGWRPQDRMIKDPIVSIDDPYSQVKYETPASLPFHIWMWVVLFTSTGLILYLFNHLDNIGLLQSLLYGAFVSVLIFSFTSLMDRSKLAIPSALIMLLFAAVLYFINDGWFGIELYVTWAGIAVLAFLLLYVGSAFYFMKTEPMYQNVGIAVS